MIKKSVVAAEHKKSITETKGPLMSKVKAKAYELWEKQGRKNGSDHKHWYEAENFVKSQVK